MQEQIDARAGLNGGGAGHDSVAMLDAETMPAMASARPPSQMQAILDDPVRREALRQRIEETIESQNSIAEEFGVSSQALSKAVRRLRWTRPPDAPKASRSKAEFAGEAVDSAGAVRAKLVAAIDRQIDLVEKRLKGRKAEVEERDSRILGNLAKTLGTLMQIGTGGATSNHAEPPDRAEDVDSRLAERIKRWARGEQGY